MVRSVLAAQSRLLRTDCDSQVNCHARNFCKSDRILKVLANRYFLLWYTVSGANISMISRKESQMSFKGWRLVHGQEKNAAVDYRPLLGVFLI